MCRNIVSKQWQCFDDSDTIECDIEINQFMRKHLKEFRPLLMFYERVRPDFDSMSKELGFIKEF